MKKASTKPAPAITLVEAPRRMAMLETHMRYDVLLDGVHYDTLQYNMTGYIGKLPTPDGCPLSIGERGITAFKREISSLNKEFAAHRSLPENQIPRYRPFDTDGLRKGAEVSLPQPGERLVTITGLATTPYYYRPALSGAWLLENCLLEAEMRSDRVALDHFKNFERKPTLQSADMEVMRNYLFVTRDPLADVLVAQKKRDMVSLLTIESSATPG